MSLIVHKGRLLIQGFPNLLPEVQGRISEALGHVGLEPDSLRNDDGVLCVPQYIENGSGRTDLAPVIGRILGYVHPRKTAGAKSETQTQRRYPTPLDFETVYRSACAFADAIESRHEELAAVLLRHESFEVLEDETARTLDLLRSLPENAEYFQRRIGPVAAFLPRNQPLYALACFGLVPALMASEVHVKPPSSMEQLFRDLANCLSLGRHFPNVVLSRLERGAFVRERAALQAGSSVPVTDAVVFTGTMTNADKLRGQFAHTTLFIANGAGHNPVVVAADADIAKAVASVMRVQLYNSGQDCASPNAVLIHGDHYPQFAEALRAALSRVRVGEYQDRATRVGALSDHKGLSEILEVFVENAAYLDPLTPGVVRGGPGIVEPTIIHKPLSAGGNFTEYFAPIFFVQRYERDEELALYFNDQRYAQNAMYVTVYGSSPFVDGLLTRSQTDGRPLHDALTIVRNSDLHAPGVERGTQRYGGYGRGASCVSINGRVEAKPTLPQRDFYEYLVRPAVEAERGC